MQGFNRRLLRIALGTAALIAAGGRAVISKPAHFENPNLNLAFVGSYNLMDETIDGRFVIHFLTMVDEVIRAVPGVRTLILNKRLGLVPIWVEVKGPRENPKITTLPAKSISDALWQPISNIFRVPLDLLKKNK